MNDDDRKQPGPLSEARRRAYLDAMGIPLWVPRDAPVAPEPEPDAASAPDAPEPTSGPAAASPQAPGPDVPQPAATGPEADAATAAEGSADVAAMDWDSLRDTILGCTRCGLCESRTRAVPGVGNRHAELLVIGEAPGQEEDRRGEPFVGRAGQLLDRMLGAIGLDRETVFITNVLKCRPPKNRDPKPEEARACSPYLRRQIELIEPKIILSVGRVSAQQLLETSETIGRLRGGWHEFGPNATPLLVTYHPAYLLRSPGEKRKAWADLKRVRDRLRG